MGANTNPQENTKQPELKDPLDSRKRLDALKLSVESGLDENAVNKLFEQYAENAEVTDGQLPESLSPEKIQEISAAMPKELIQRLAGMVIDAKLKTQLSTLADGVTPGQVPESVAAAGKGSPILQKFNDFFTKALANPTFKPFLDKLHSLGVKDESIVSGAMGLLSQVLLTMTSLPFAQMAAAEIAFAQVKETILSDPTLSPEQRQERLEAHKGENGRSNFMSAFITWIKGGKLPYNKPGSEALLAAPPTQVAAAPTTSPVASPSPTPQIKPAEVVSDKKVEGKRLVRLSESTTLDVTRNDAKTIITVDGRSVEVNVVNGGNTLNMTTRDAIGTEQAVVTFMLAQDRTVPVSAQKLSDAVKEKRTECLAIDNTTIISLLEIKNT